MLVSPPSRPPCYSVVLNLLPEKIVARASLPVVMCDFFGRTSNESSVEWQSRT